MIYNNREVNCKTFSSKQDWKIRVVFDERGEPFFCARDVATSMGYEEPGKAVGRSKLEKVPMLLPWQSGHRKGCSENYCFSADTMLTFIKSASIRLKPGFIQWIKDEVIPGARAEGIPAKPATRPDPEAARQPAATPPPPTGIVVQRIDEIILELMLLKKALA